MKRFNNHNTHQQIVRIASPITSAANSVSTTSVKLATVASTMPASKFLVLQSTDGNASTTIATSSNATATTYLNGQDGSKVVLVTNEQMIGAIDQNGTTTVTTTNSTNDEELTSLTWLHDKNLLKGMSMAHISVLATTVNNIESVHFSLLSPRSRQALIYLVHRMSSTLPTTIITWIPIITTVTQKW